MPLLVGMLLLLAPTESFTPLIEKVVERGDETARATLLRKGTPALPALAEALGQAVAKRNAAAQKRLESLVAAIREREPHGLDFHVGLPKMKLTQETGVDFTLSVRNKSDVTVVIYPYFTIRLLDKDGKEVKRSRKLGRGGLRPDGHPLEHVEFVKLEPGQRWHARESLAQFTRDPQWITGWKTPPPGEYVLELTYDYDRKLADGLPGREHAAHKALAFRHRFTQPLRIEP